ncbi:acyl-CoA thioesterase [Aromatoleum diolicum]|uniref:Thioesterase n=1 Tax=Aromatoleum diolicum TaxID=75796 RepID=A0ABX1QAR9_9RHOO|nr:thioesterase family protein [Aromatoleum diolicum]NMG75488.1 thioesterase [Aromatoleum diolicum]
MPRIRIDLPEHFAFSTELQIYASHINEAAHLDNAQLLTLVSEARQRFFKSLGYTQTQVEGVGTVVADAATQYVSEAFHGETLVIEMAANDFNKYGCDLVYRVCDRDSGREVARGKIGIVFFDYGNRKVVAVPERFREQLSAV